MVKADKSSSSSRNAGAGSAPGATTPALAAELAARMGVSLSSVQAAQAVEFLETLAAQLRATAQEPSRAFNTPYVNTIPVEQQPPFPGDWQMERRIKSYIRWNAMAMGVRANSKTNVGGHISTYASHA
ncbi:MAG: pyruvate dehydrogenase (acetyl-transferring), homodimeric type, partial [Verrucomicrobiae bacterium]|nr:pyruvate dehydrogenase (acetyl-transferring), homodimeric type [Verrucomicrobiae bacterium]